MCHATGLLRARRRRKFSWQFCASGRGGPKSLPSHILICGTLMMNPRLVLHLFLAFFPFQSVLSAFTTPSCGADRDLCVKQEDGVWCFSSTRTTNDTKCPHPYSIPLTSHLEQNYSIAYYSSTGQPLGDADYFVPDTDITYLCMSTWVGDDEHYTVCGQVFQDDTWNVDCEVNVAPSDVIDGCYVCNYSLLVYPQFSDLIFSW